MNGIGPELPFSRDEKFGNYSLVTSYVEQVKQNFKNLLLTIPGERIMNPDFGVGLKKYLFENRDEIKPRIKQRIESQVRKYMPFIRINGVYFDSGNTGEQIEESHILAVVVSYEVPNLNLATEIVLQAEDIS